MTTVAEETQPEQTAQQKSQAELLAAYKITGNITQACEVVKIGRTTHYRWLKTDPEYAASFEEAKPEAVQGLEDEAIKRAKSGSDVLLIFLLKGAYPAKYRERYDLQHTGKDGEKLFDLASVRAFVQES